MTQTPCTREWHALVEAAAAAEHLARAVQALACPPPLPPIGQAVVLELRIGPVSEQHR